MTEQTALALMGIAFALVAAGAGIVAPGVGIKVLVVSAIVLLGLGVGFYYHDHHASDTGVADDQPAATSSGPSVDSSPTATDSSTNFSTGLPATAGTLTEVADNRSGVKVYGDPSGSAVPDGVPQTIPFGTKVQVSCVAPNESGMTSVHAFYHVVGGEWAGQYAVSDSFANGGALGSDNGIMIDPNVPTC